MAKSFWGAVHSEAVAETLADLGLSSGRKIMIRAVLAVGIVLALILWGSEDASRDEMVFRIAGVALIALLFPLLYVWNFVKTPPRMYGELSAKANSLARQIGQSGPKLSIQIEQVAWGGSAAGRDGQSIIFVVASVSNAGAAASAVRSMELLHIGTNGSTPLSLTRLPELTLGNVNYGYADALYNKARSPVQPGGIVTGHLIALVPTRLTDAINEGDELLLTAQNVHGDTVEARHVFKRSNDENRYVPGLESFSIQGE